MKSLKPLAMTALVFLFLAEGQRVFFASLFGLVYDAVFPALSGGRLLLASIPLLGLLAPLLPLARWADRAGAVAVAAAGVAVFRVPLSLPGLLPRVVASTLVVAAAALFLTWAVGFVERRAIAAGAVIGLAADHLLRLAGTSFDITLRSGWIPVQAALSLGLLWLVVSWTRDPEAGEREDPSGLERRAGGLRLRGALALGVLLFLDLHLVGLTPVVSRWARVPYELAGLMVAAASAVAIAVALAARGPIRNRMAALGLVGLLGGALLAGWFVTGTLVGVLMAAGHGAALVLIARTLNPASGRRGRAIATWGMLTFGLFTALWAATFFYAHTFPALQDRGGWILGLAVLLLAGCFILLPQPPATEPVVGRWAAAGTGAAAPLLAALLLFGVIPGEPRLAEVGTVSGQSLASREVRVGTWNVHYGWDEEWTFDPAAVARTIRRSGAELVALQEVPVGLPVAYGVDLPLYLERTLGMESVFAPTVAGLRGDAVLTRLPYVTVQTDVLPPPEADRRQLIRLTVALDGRTLTFYASHLSEEPGARRQQLEALVRMLSPGRFILLGDLNAGPDSDVARALRALGAVDAFELAAVPAEPTAPAAAPTERIDWVWVRGFWVNDAFVMDRSASDHRMVVATLQAPGLGVR